MSRSFNFEIFTRSRISWIYVVLLISAIWCSLSISKLDSVFISSVYLHQNCRFFSRWSTTFHDFSNVFSGFLSHRRCHAIYSWIYFHTYTDLASLSILHSIVNFDFPVKRSASKRFLASRQSTVVRCLTLVRDPTTCPSIYPPIELRVESAVRSWKIGQRSCDLVGLEVRSIILYCDSSNDRGSRHRFWNTISWKSCCRSSRITNGRVFLAPLCQRSRRSTCSMMQRITGLCEIPKRNTIDLPRSGNWFCLRRSVYSQLHSVLKLVSIIRLSADQKLLWILWLKMTILNKFIYFKSCKFISKIR